MSRALLLLALLSPQQKDPDQVRITLKVADMSLDKVIDKIALDSGVPIAWTAEAKKKVDGQAAITVDIQDMVLTGALKLILLPQGLDAKAVEQKKVLIIVP
jgi:hypothetical protein